ncbi:MAG: SAM-dependent methyltransferase, partial [Clostridia bacterium]|nr:SAM-dependent methyltransferase [Clostridia bacterium]
MLSLPSAFVERMKKLLGEKYDSFYNEIASGSPSKAFFTNKKTNDKNVFGDEPVPYYENGFYFELDGIGNTPLHHAGGIYIQDPSAMAAMGAVEGHSFKNVL